MTEMTDLIIPTVHLNGTSKEWLIETRCNAAKALREAYESLQAQCPNGRDFPQGGFVMARVIHDKRLEAVRALRDALMSEAEAISDQQGLRYDNLITNEKGETNDTQ